MKTRKIITAVFIIIALVGIVIAGHWKLSYNQTQNENILAAAVGAETSLLDVGVVPIAAMKENQDDTGVVSFTEEQINAVLTEKRENYAPFLHSYLVDSYVDMAKAAYEHIDISNITVDAGVLDADIKDITKLDSYAIINTTTCQWTVTIQKNKHTEEYTVHTTYVNWAGSYSLQGRGGNQWLVLSAGGDYLNEQQSIQEGSFSTLEQALTAASNINPEDKNPF